MCSQVCEGLEEYNQPEVSAIDLPTSTSKASFAACVCR